MNELGSLEAKPRLAELLRLSEKGDEIVALRRGPRVAAILGSSRDDRIVRAAPAGRRQTARECLSRGPHMSRTESEVVVRESRVGRA